MNAAGGRSDVLEEDEALVRVRCCFEETLQEEETLDSTAAHEKASVINRTISWKRLLSVPSISVIYAEWPGAAFPSSPAKRGMPHFEHSLVVH